MIISTVTRNHLQQITQTKTLGEQFMQCGVTMFPVKFQARRLHETKKDLSPSMWAQLFHARISQEDCVNKVLCSFMQ